MENTATFVSNWFEYVARALPVSVIADKVRTITSDSPIWMAGNPYTEDFPFRDSTYPNLWVVTESGSNCHVVGYLFAGTETEESPNEPVGQFCRVIPPWQIVPASMPILELIPLLKQSDYFFVFERNEINHVVSFANVIEKHPFRLALLSLLLAFQQELAGTIELSTIPLDQSLPLMGKKRYNEMREIVEKKRQARTSLGTTGTHGYSEKDILRDIVNAASFGNLRTIFNSVPGLMQLLPLPTPIASAFLKRCNDVRNAIAHENSLENIVDDPVSLNELLSDLLRCFRVLDLHNAHVIFYGNDSNHPNEATNLSEVEPF
jgi:hypothetical protein